MCVFVCVCVLGYGFMHGIVPTFKREGRNCTLKKKMYSICEEECPMDIDGKKMFPFHSRFRKV